MSDVSINIWKFVDDEMKKFIGSNFCESKEEFLFHYTGFSALKGILEKEEIWAFDCRFMNDPTEVGIFFPNLIENLDNYALDNDIIHFIREVIEDHNSVEEYHPDRNGKFIFSLSDNKQSVGLWREYAANGSGVVIKTSRENLIESVKKTQHSQPHNCKIYKINYLKKDQIKDLVQDFIEKCKGVYRQIEQKFGPEFPRDAFKKSVLLNCWLLSALIKHESYIEENEHRLIFEANLQISEIKYLESKGCLRPYVPLSFLIHKDYCGSSGSDRLIEDIEVGFNAHQRAESSIRMLWQTCGMKLVSEGLSKKINSCELPEQKKNFSSLKPLFVSRSEVPIQAK